MTVKIETVDGQYKAKIEELRELLKSDSSYPKILVFDSIEKLSIIMRLE